MTREELIATLKANNKVAFDKVNENDIRMAVVFREFGFFCGYIGLPANHPLFEVSEDEIENIFSSLCNGGVTYDEYEAPTNICADKERRWVGFDCGHSFNAANIELTKEIYGDQQAARAAMIQGTNGLHVTCDGVISEVNDMALTADKYEVKKMEKFWYFVRLAAEGITEGYVQLTEAEAEAVAKATNTDNWSLCEYESYSGSFYIDLNSKRERKPTALPSDEDDDDEDDNWDFSNYPYDPWDE